MESISCDAKRKKKRKTRKCLDEIRKRSQRNISQNAGPGMSKTDYKPGNISEMKPSVYITSKRLTLEMFPKVIRSETVTRPVLSEINKDYNLDLDETTVKCSIKPDADELITIPQSNCDSDYSKNLEDNYVDTRNTGRESCNSSGTSQISIEKDSHSNNGNLSNHDNSPGSVLVFSPVNQSDDIDLFEVSSKETLPSTSAQSSHNSEGPGNYEGLYEEFVNEMPMYLEQYAAGLLEGDIMKTTREMIHQMHLHSLNKVQDKEDSIYQGMRKQLMALKGSSSESSEPVPRKYMRPGRRVGGLSHDAGNSSPPHSFTTPPPALGPTALLDTPEYTYYPHKLNQ